MPMGPEPQVTAAAEMVEEAALQGAQPAESHLAETVEALAQVLEDTKAAGEPVDAIAEAVANSDTIKPEIIGDKATGRVLVITTEPENAEAAAQPESDVPGKKPAGKGRGKKGAAKDR